jgi:flagellar M-ring protein FliF
MATGEAMKSMGKGRLLVMIFTALACLGVFGVLALKITQANLVPLYTNLSLEDSAKLVSELEKTGVPYELASGGTQIMVPADRVLRLRMSMAGQGLPSIGSIVGYEIFDREAAFGSSNFVMNINMVRALEGELARTISSITNVDSARVHLVMPHRELFSRDRGKPSASVTIKMRGGHSLERAEVTSVTHLVASAVPGLEASRVTVVDNFGRLLARGDGSEGMNASASTAQDYRTAYENRVQNVLEDLIEKVVGVGKVRVTVSADINFDRTVINSEKYDPEGQVARSTQSTSDKENAQDKMGKDNVSVAGNLPEAKGAGESTGGSNRDAEQTSETINYEISKTVQNQIKEGGNVNKISVAALVDGKYSEPDADGKTTYSPRTEEELKQIKTLITTAIGYDEKRGDKIEVVNMPFSQAADGGDEESFFQKFKLEMQGIIQTLIMGVVAILAILLVLRPALMIMLKQVQAPSDKVAGDLAALEGPAAAAGRLPAAAGGGMMSAEPELLIDVANVKGGMKSSSMKKINEIVEKYPEETMGVLRQWIMRQA